MSQYSKLSRNHQCPTRRGIFIQRGDKRWVITLPNLSNILKCLDGKRYLKFRTKNYKTFTQAMKAAFSFQKKLEKLFKCRLPVFVNDTSYSFMDHKHSECRYQRIG